MNNTELRSLVRTLIEARIRETDITDGTRVPFGSPEHVTDVEMRISDLERWRDRQRRGSEARANYARLIGALKRELRSATRVNAPKLVEPDVMTPEMHEADGDKKKAKKVVHWEHTRGTGGACGKSGSSTSTKSDVTCAKCKKMVAKEKLAESVDMEDPEFATVEGFVQFMLDDERDSYTHEELAALNFRTRMPINAIRKELEGYGLKLATRAPEKEVRGFTSNSHDRWHGKGSMATHGGAGIDPQTGRATSGRGDI